MAASFQDFQEGVTAAFGMLPGLVEALAPNPARPRSRSPRRAPRLEFPRSINRTFEHMQRHGSLIAGGFRLLDAYVKAPDDLEGLGRQTSRIIGDIGGAILKVTQQVAALPALIPSDLFRQGLGRLFDNNPPRARSAIETQVRDGLSLAGVSIERVLKVGTIAEVCLISIPNEGGEAPRQYAVKTANLQQRNLYRTDFEMFSGSLMGSLSGVFKAFEKVSRHAAMVQAMVQQAVNIGRDQGFQETTMNEFNLRLEADNMAIGSLALRSAAEAAGHPPQHFRVPKVIKVSEGGDVMQMELVRGQNLNDSHHLENNHRVQIIEYLIEIFVHGLLCGPVVHADLHPGNVMVAEGQPGLTIVDWGFVLQVPAEHRTNVRRLLRRLHVDTNADFNFREAFMNFGVTLKQHEQPATDQQYRQLASLFDVVAGARGETNAIEMLREMHKFNWPDWMILWQRAIGAMINSLCHLNAAHLVDLRLKMRDVIISCEV